jgi:hypothetical protein
MIVVWSAASQVLKSGGRWVNALGEYGPKDSLQSFVRRAEKGVWTVLFETLAQAGRPPTQVIIDFPP